MKTNTLNSMKNRVIITLIDFLGFINLSNHTYSHYWLFTLFEQVLTKYT